MIIRKLLFILFSFSGFVYSQTKEDIQRITKDHNLGKLKTLQNLYEENELAEKRAAYEAAQKNGWPILIKSDNGSIQELIKLTEDGFPVYLSAHNVAAAVSTRTNHLNSGGSLGLNLNGQGMVARVWDGDVVRRTHNLFGGRVQTVDDSSNNFSSQDSGHATHVTGTIIAANDNLNTTKGMAYQASARTFNWTNDESEVVSEVNLGMLVSNHSYGIPLTSGSGSTLPAWYIGSYIDDSRVWDEIAYNSPFYLSVFSAGNDGNNNNNPNPIAPGFDKLIGNKVSKNVLTVANAQDANVNSDGTLVSVQINSSSSQGPTDDRRIKPDITGNGTGLISTYNTNDNSTVSLSGTSMAAPNVTGSLLLLQQLSKNETNSYMKASTLKGLVCHTADDAGSIGPDPIFGWGLLNSKKAAETILNNGLNSWISEEKLVQGQTYSKTVKSDGTTPLIISVSWTDVPGFARNSQTTPNDLTPALVNDLDIRVTHNGTTFFPWRLNNNPSILASRNGDNNVDNVERVQIDNPLAGDYVITVNHKGSLVNSFQDFSIIITGVNSSFSITPISENLELCSNENAVFTFDYKQVSSGTTNFSPVGLPNGALVSISPTSLTSSGSVTMTISNLNSLEPNIYTVGLEGDNGIETEAKFRSLRVMSSSFEPIDVLYPINNLNGTPTVFNFDWKDYPNIKNYNLQMSRNSNFSPLLLSRNLSTSTFQVPSLMPNSLYYWRLIPSNDCATANSLSVPIYSFRTGSIACGNIFTATNFSNSQIFSNEISNATIPLEISGGLIIGQLKVNLTINHSNVGDLTIVLRGPDSLGNPEIVLINEVCGEQDNINVTISQNGTELECLSSSPTITGDILPNQNLSVLNGLLADGTWTLLVKDPYIGAGGSITNFSIEICNVTATLSENDNILNSLKVYPNPAKGIVNIDLAGSVSGETVYELFDVQGRKVISKVSSNTVETLNIENLSGGIYLLTIENSGAKTTKKLIIN